jgi:predicted enzyme related to lactoylglutathione lyase
LARALAGRVEGRVLGVGGKLKIKLTGVRVDDQDKALKFYTEVLGFEKSKDIPLGAFKCRPLSRSSTTPAEI